MEEYFELISKEFLLKLKQIKVYIKRHNPTIGVLTEEVLRDFLRKHLPQKVNIAQGFIRNSIGELSGQCDVIIYDSHSYAPLYQINDIVIVPEAAVLAVIEVKTTINKNIFHSVINYYKAFHTVISPGPFKTYLFMLNSEDPFRIGEFLESYEHIGDYQGFDWDTFYELPDVIVGVDKPCYLFKNSIITDKDLVGYTSEWYEDVDSPQISPLMSFWESLNELIKKHQHFEQVQNSNLIRKEYTSKDQHERPRMRQDFISLFDM